MKSDIKQKWVAALRSGDYQQTDGHLRRPDESDDASYGFCCLGVLCDVMGAKWDSGIPLLDGTSLKNPDDDEFLNDDTLDAVGLASSQQSSLAEMNDSGSTFDTIADHIEENL